MTVAGQQPLYDLLKTASHRAAQRSEQILVSQLSRVSSVHPLAFYHCNVTDKFYWAHAEDHLFVAGLGTAYTLGHPDGDRFQSIDNQRRQLLAHSVVMSDDDLTCTGPVFFGGFSFDPLQKMDETWQDFSSDRLVLPQLMLTEVDGRQWLTTNVVVTPETDISLLYQHMRAQQEHYLSMARAFQTTLQEALAFTVEEVAPERWKAQVNQAARQIREQWYDKVVLTRLLHLEAAAAIDCVSVIQRLLKEQPFSYIFAVTQGESTFLGASPERLVKRQNQQLQSACLASTVARGDTVQEDEAYGRWLLQDEKNRHEHQLVVDMIQSAMAKVCQRVYVPEQPVLYKMKDIQHLYTPMIGASDNQSSLLQLVAQLHPTPALGGYPQQQALEVIRTMEQHHRGWYGAPIGWLDDKGDGEFAVAIRSGLIQGHHATLFAGSGIVGDSDADSEYHETDMKFRPMLSALGGDYSWHTKKM